MQVCLIEITTLLIIYGAYIYIYMEHMQGPYGHPVARIQSSPSLINILEARQRRERKSTIKRGLWELVT